MREKNEEEDIAKLKFLGKEDLITTEDTVEVAVDVSQMDDLQQEARKKREKVTFLKIKAEIITQLKQIMEATSVHHHGDAFQNIKQDVRDDDSKCQSDVTVKTSSRSRDVTAASAATICQRDNVSAVPQSKTLKNKSTNAFKKKSIPSPFFSIQKDDQAEIPALPHSKSASDMILKKVRQSSVRFVF